MARPRFHPMPTRAARRFRAGAPDALGCVPERRVSDGEGNPCRHCLCEIPKGAAMLVLSWRPFETRQPYAEAGPVFLCADDCTPFSGLGLPDILTTSPSYMLRAYGPDERIVYGTGGVVEAGDLSARAAALLDRTEVAFVDVRSASNGCFQCRVRAG
ncbi:MAG: DUF1203 domain-containing protein [Pseudomonadota bacterium]